MYLILFLTIYSILISVFIFGGRKFYNQIGVNFGFLNGIKEQKWFKNHWISGFTVFLLNALLVFISYGLVYLFSLPEALREIMNLQYLFMIIILSLSMTGSFLLWFIVRNIWQGTSANRLKMSLIGSSFYVLAALLSIYKFINTDYPFPDKELYYGNLTLVLASVLLFLANFIILGFRRNES